VLLHVYSVESSLSTDERVSINTLSEQFSELAQASRELIGLLDEADEKYWKFMLERALPKVNAHELAGATLILGCYGGMDTFSDLIIGGRYEEGEPLKYQNLNARLMHLRTRTFEAARRIAARQVW
jgi:hypothetical protein